MPPSLPIHHVRHGQPGRKFGGTVLWSMRSSLQGLFGSSRKRFDNLTVVLVLVCLFSFAVMGFFWDSSSNSNGVELEMTTLESPGLPSHLNTHGMPVGNSAGIDRHGLDAPSRPPIVSDAAGAHGSVWPAADNNRVAADNDQGHLRHENDGQQVYHGGDHSATADSDIDVDRGHASQSDAGAPDAHKKEDKKEGHKEGKKEDDQKQDQKQEQKVHAQTAPPAPSKPIVNISQDPKYEPPSNKKPNLDLSGSSAADKDAKPDHVTEVSAEKAFQESFDSYESATKAPTPDPIKSSIDKAKDKSASADKADTPAGTKPENDGKTKPVAAAKEASDLTAATKLSAIAVNPETSDSTTGQDAAKTRVASPNVESSKAEGAAEMTGTGATSDDRAKIKPIDKDSANTTTGPTDKDGVVQSGAKSSIAESGEKAVETRPNAEAKSGTAEKLADHHEEGTAFPDTKAGAKQLSDTDKASHSAEQDNHGTRVDEPATKEVANKEAADKEAAGTTSSATPIKAAQTVPESVAAHRTDNETQAHAVAAEEPQKDPVVRVDHSHIKHSHPSPNHV
ncbi:hypothetical protein BC831DRAFT_551006 [Entophlyctis helioformis]|nr:hypothetical protein BC831DRAFT_551006 [Entophlyctis helioformis]